MINQERKRKGIPPVKWTPQMYRLAKEQANKMAKLGRLIHSGRPALAGGENCWMGKGYHDKALPKAIVNSWMKSHIGHREWLLEPKAQIAAIGIAKGRQRVFVAWSFSANPPSLWSILLRFLFGY